MLIGGDFNNRAKQLLSLVAKMSDNNPEVKIAVQDLVEQIDTDRSELKNILGYLENKDLISIASIGGPFLYGHIRITEKGITKSSKIS